MIFPWAPAISVSRPHRFAGVSRAGATSQHGQVLPLALCLIAVGALAWMALYGIGQVANARVRLTHTADAVAYSGAAAQARMLNLLAYINRAHVAHQVVMAHLVTLASWADFGETQALMYAKFDPPPWVIDTLFGEDARQAYSQAHDSGDAVAELIQSFQEHDEVVHEILRQASTSAVEDMKTFRHQVMRRVLQANYPDDGTIGSWRERFTSGYQQKALPRMLWLSDALPGFVKPYGDGGSGHLRNRIAHALEQHVFLHPRDVTRYSERGLRPECPEKRFELRRRGETRLDAEGYWSSRDTLSYQRVDPNAQIGCFFREYPMGWGLAESRLDSSDSGIKLPDNFSKQPFWRWASEHASWDIFKGSTNHFADEKANSNSRRWSSFGLPRYHELSDPGAHQTLRFAIQLRQSAADATAQGRRHPAAMSGGRFGLSAFTAEDAIGATSAAETYFEGSSSDKDGAYGVASLFHPHWRARLSAVRHSDVATPP